MKRLALLTAGACIVLAACGSADATTTPVSRPEACTPGTGNCDGPPRQTIGPKDGLKGLNGKPWNLAAPSKKK
jgi:hypothetical protein